MISKFGSLPSVIALILMIASVVSPLAVSAQSSVAPNGSEATAANSVFTNPIELSISKDVITGDLPSIDKKITVEQAIEIALRQSPVVRQSEQQRNAARSMRRAALGRFGPSASANMFFAHSGLNQMLFLSSDAPVAAAPMQPIRQGTAMTVLFAGRQPIFTGGRLLGNYRVAQARARQSEAALSSNRVTAAQQVRKAYWRSALFWTRMQLANEYAKYWQRNVENMRTATDEGKLPRADLLRVEAESAQSEQKLNEAIRDFNVALLELKASMAVNFTSKLELVDELSYTPQSGSLNSFLAQAKSARPELAAAQARMGEMRAQKMVAVSQYSPQIELFGLGGNLTGQVPDTPDGSAHGQWGGAIGIIGGITLFDSGKRWNELKAASASVRESEQSAQSAEINAARQVTTAWITVLTAQKNVELAKKRVASAEEDKRLIHARFEVGKSIALEDFQAAVAAFAARESELSAIYEFRSAQADLLAAVGVI